MTPSSGRGGARAPVRGQLAWWSITAAAGRCSAAKAASKYRCRQKPYFRVQWAVLPRYDAALRSGLAAMGVGR